MLHLIHEVAEDIRRQVKRDREKRRDRQSRDAGRPTAPPRSLIRSLGAARLPRRRPSVPESRWHGESSTGPCGWARAASSATTSAASSRSTATSEIELLDDGEIRARADELRRRADDGEPLDDLPPKRSRSVARRQAQPRPAPLRRPADRRHGPGLGDDRRDAHRRGQDPDRDPGGVPEHARGRSGPPGHGQRLPRPPRRRVVRSASCSASPSA